MEHRETSSQDAGSEYLLCLSIISNYTNPNSELFDRFATNPKERRIVVKDNSNLISLHNELFVLPGVNSLSSPKTNQSVARIEKRQGLLQINKGKFIVEKNNIVSDSSFGSEYFSASALWSVLEQNKVKLKIND